MPNPNWKKGMASPNPSGRPRLPEGVRRILEDAAPAAALEIVKALRDENSSSTRFQAAEAILNRLYGKPHQSADVEVTETPKTDFIQGQLEDLTEEQLVAAIASASLKP